MDPALTERHYVLGIEGLALLRAGAGRDVAGIADRVQEMRETAAAVDAAPERTLPAEGPERGYADWAAGYDEPGNDTIAIEEPAVLDLLRDLPGGTVLDAACGTGR